MTHRPLVSVIVPAYNAGQLLARCLDTLAAQSYPRVEVIVVNDGSTDGSTEVVSTFMGRMPGRFTLIDIPHGGRARARQAGVDAAAGEFIGFVDADDTAHADLYAALVAACTEQPGADVAVCRYRNVAADGTAGHIYEEGTPELFGGSLADMPELLYTVEASLCNKLFSRSLFDGVTFPPGRDFEDLATTYRLLGRARRIARVDGPPLYFYHQGGPVSVMAAHGPEYIDAVEAIRTTCDFFRAEGAFEILESALLRLTLRHLVFSRFGGLFERGTRVVVRRYLDAVYGLLDAQFPHWRRSKVLREMCGSVWSYTLVRSKMLMWLFTLVRSRAS